MNYVAFYPPLYSTRAPVAAPVAGLLPAGQPATVAVIVPADAVVRFDGHKTRQTGSHRLFTTPDLENGKSYHYAVQATFLRDGKPFTQSQRVEVRTGGLTSAVFPIAR